MLCDNSRDADISAVDEEGEAGADYKAWEAKFRCLNLKTSKKHSVGKRQLTVNCNFYIEFVCSFTLRNRSLCMYVIELFSI